MQPRLENIPDKKLLGKRVRMTLAHNRTAELWSSLMPRRREIKNKLNDDLISMQIFDESFNFRNFNENTVFEKWAAVEVTDFDSIPQGLESAVLKGGLYAILRVTIGMGNGQGCSETYWISLAYGKGN
jgi:AraC family transcriptional regulator